jgi:hypothetical protein
MIEQETVFADGMIFKIKDNQPNFVIGNISVKVEDFIKFLNENAKDGWVNLQVLKSKGGKPYTKLDTWEPKTPQSDNVATNFKDDDSQENSLPF